MTDSKKAMTDRRVFLGLAAAVATGGIATGTSVADPDPEPANRTAADVYRETEHILTAYRRMRF